MVVFSCGQCGEALKKAQVEKHYQTRCRKNNVFSCIDCGKDFWGTDYEQHTKCITEAEKYSGKDFVPKPSSNKGDRKQQQWLQQIQEGIDKAKADPQLKALLERIKDYPNIPRKKPKFENFLKNSLMVRNPRLMTQAWDVLIAHAEKPSSAAADGKIEDKSAANEQNSQTEVETNVEKQSNDNEKVKKLSKRERKEERRKQSQKVEKKHKHSNGLENDIKNNESQSETKSKKKRKRKHQEDIETEEDLKKRHQSVEDEDQENQENDVSELDQTVNDDEETSEPPKKKYKTKFNWEEVMQQVIKKKEEMSVKKLRKKVLAEYLAQGCTAKSEEKLWAKFNKKLKKNPAFKVLKDRVKLVS